MCGLIAVLLGQPNLTDESVVGARWRASLPAALRSWVAAQRAQAGAGSTGQAASPGRRSGFLSLLLGGLSGETLLLVITELSELLRDSREDDVSERLRGRGVDETAPPGQHVIDQRAELLIVAVLTQQRERVAKFRGRLGFLVGHCSSPEAGVLTSELGLGQDLAGEGKQREDVPVRP